MKMTMEALAKHIGKSRQSLYHMKKVSPEQFKILWLGWTTYCNNQ